jgi:endonuclease/exonuclease/phosphatase family metal-dependent hydrolase
MTDHSVQERKRVPAIALLRQLKSRRWWTIATGWLVWLYLLSVVVALLLLRYLADRWWFATMMLFGPRWVYLLPLVALLPLALVFRRRLLWPLATSFVLVFWLIMGFCLPWGRLCAPDGPRFRVLTCNTDAKAVNPDALMDIIRKTKPDVVALQESGLSRQFSWPKEWHHLQRGELTVASPYPIEEIKTLWGKRPGHVWPRPTVLYCRIRTPDRDVDFGCLHLPSPRYGISRVLDRSTVIAPSRSDLLDEGAVLRRCESERVTALVENHQPATILAGDFNTPTDSPVYRESWGKFRNAFLTSGFGFGNTIYAKIRGWPIGIRIDHILMGSDWWPKKCWVGPDVGSEHRPVIADLVWIGELDEE